jgi:antitoxin ParD1/3/4
MTMNINLTPQLEELVRQKVSSGRYTSASEVVREALRLMEEQDRLRAMKLEQLRRDIREGLESGPPTSWNVEEMKRDGRKQLAARRSSRNHK